MRSILISLILFFSGLPASASDARAYASFDRSDLDWVSARIRVNDDSLRPAYRELLRRADRALSRTPKTVMDKEGIASSKDKHDFYSAAKYGWANEDDAAGAPYIRRDGQRNPEAQGAAYDKRNFNESIRIVNALALAYHLSGNKAYAEKAGLFLRAWFIDPRTRMNPNFRHAAVLPGRNDGSYGGIIEGVVLIEMLDYVALLDGSNALSVGEERELRSWFARLADWLIQSDFGRREARMQNNHGSWYDAQVIAFSIYGGNVPRARSLLPSAKERLLLQFSEDGSMPKEMARTDSAMYSIYGIRSFIALARLSDGLGDSLWKVEKDGQPVLKRALTHLAPFYSGKQTWTAGSVHRGTDQYAIQVFRLGARAYRTEEFNDVLAHLVSNQPESNRYIRLLGPPRFPAP